MDDLMTWHLGCVSQDSHPRKSILRKEGNWDQITPSNSPKARGTTSNTGKMGPSRGVIQKCGPPERYPCAPRFEDRTQDETLHQEGNLAKMSISSKERVKLRFTLLPKHGDAGTLFKKARRTRIRGRLGSIDAHAEQKGSKLR